MIGVVVGLVIAAAAAKSSTAIALPVADGRPSNGPFTIQVWPDEGCKGCEINPTELAALRTVLADFRAPRGAQASYSKVRYFVVPAGTNFPALTSIDKIRKTLAGCTVGSTGKLATNPTSSLSAFGARFDCAAIRKYRWMSVVMSNDHQPAAVYFLPDDPIHVARTH